MESGLRLNSGKTQTIFFAPSVTANRIRKSGSPGVSLSPGTIIPFAETLLSLGVVLDRTLSWKPHFDYIISKASRALYSLRFFRSCTTELLRRQLVQALIFPILEYCSIVTIDTTNEQKTRLQKLQNSCIRYIYAVKWNDHVTPYRRRLGWLRTDTRRLYYTSVLTYKILNFRAPSYLHEMFEKRQLTRPARGGSRDLKIPKVDTPYGQRSFCVQAMNLWNSLPDDVKYLPTLSRFKSALADYLFTLD